MNDKPVCQAHILKVDKILLVAASGLWLFHEILADHPIYNHLDGTDKSQIINTYKS